MRFNWLFLAVLIFLCGCTVNPDNFGNISGVDNLGGNIAGDSDSFLDVPDLIVGAAPEAPVLGENVTLNLGDLVITYYSTVISYPDFLPGSDILIHVRNAGSGTETVFVNSTTPPAETVMHYFKFNNGSLVVGPGEEGVIHYFASDDSSNSYNLIFDLWTESDASDLVSADISVYAGEPVQQSLKNSARVTGFVKDADGNPVPNADVELNTYSGRLGFMVSTDSTGFYYVDIPGSDGLINLVGGQETLYNPSKYFIIVDADGYNYYYNDSFIINRGETLVHNVELTPAGVITPYVQDWEFNVSEYYGFWWLRVSDDWTKVLATQAKHNPELGLPADFYLLNAETGEELWSYHTEDQCWGSDLSNDGSMAVTGCNDNNIYAVNADSGNLIWSYDSPNINRDASLSNNGKYLVSGPVDGGMFGLFNAETGELLKDFNDQNEWLRNSVFSPDDSRFYVSLGYGYLGAYDTLTGEKLWDDYTGEFLLYMGVDNNGNLYGSGKGRILYSWDSDGNVRWSFREPDHLSGTGAVSSDGSVVAIGSVGAWVYYFNASNGEVLWRRHLDGAENAGHNAVSITPHGETLAVGAAPDNALYVFDSKGNTIFQNTAPLNPDPVLDLKWSGIGAEASAGTQKGVMCTVISNDGSRIIAAYGDDTIRSFTRI